METRDVNVDARARARERRRWYHKAVPLAEERYKEHLATLSERGE